MYRSIRVKPEFITTVKEALFRNNFPSQGALAMEVGVSRPTVNSFLNGKPIDYLNFVECCEKLGLNWQEIAEIKDSQEDDVIDEKDPILRDLNKGFFGREEELNTLKQWIINNRCRLVGLSGMVGIGKTELAKKLAQQVQDEFDYVIYSSLKYQNSLIEILSKWLQKFANQSTKELPVSVAIGLVRLLEKLGEYRCLLVVDDGEEVLSTGEFAGKFKPEYEEYRMLLRRIGEAPHQSCLVWISREKPGEIDYLEARSKNIKSLLL